MSELIAFIGVGNMGCPMAENLMKSGKTVKVFDVSEKMLEIARDKNLEIVPDLNDLITANVGTVITMLPEGKHSKEVYLGEDGIINKVSFMFTESSARRSIHIASPKLTEIVSGTFNNVGGGVLITCMANCF